MIILEVVIMNNNTDDIPEGFTRYSEPVEKNSCHSSSNNNFDKFLFLLLLFFICKCK